MPLYLNNCRDRDHGMGYPNEGASVPFFDFAMADERARNLHPGTECVVARTEENRRVRFAWFKLTHESPHRYQKKGELCRVLYGVKVKGGGTFLQSEAAASDEYRVFFDINGNFKRTAVVEP